MYSLFGASAAFYFVLGSAAPSHSTQPLLFPLPPSVEECALWLPSLSPPQVQSVRDDSSVATCVTFVGGADIVAVGSHSGEIRMIDAVAGEVSGSPGGSGSRCWNHKISLAARFPG